MEPGEQASLQDQAIMTSTSYVVNNGQPVSNLTGKYSIVCVILWC